MKSIVIISSTVLTVGGASTASVLNTSSKEPTSLNTPTHLEISDKNIEEIANISKLKQQNKIQELEVESINDFVKADTNLNAHYHTTIHAEDEKPNITTFNNSNTIMQKRLQDLWKTQIDLSNYQETYKEIKTYVSDSSQVSASLWGTVKDTAKTSGTVDECKLEKKSNPVVSVPYDVCTADWQIITIKFEDKITQLLSEKSDLLSKFNQIPKSN